MKSPFQAPYPLSHKKSILWDKITALGRQRFRLEEGMLVKSELG
jgi:hypothetical protein